MRSTQVVASGKVVTVHYKLQLDNGQVVDSSEGGDPMAYLHGVNRPDLPAKFHLVEFPIFLALAWLLMPRWGVAGAAAVWTIRVGVDTSLLLTAVHRTAQRSAMPSRRPWQRAIPLLAIAGGVVAAAFPLLPEDLMGRVAAAAGATFVLGVASWFVLLDRTERAQIRELARNPLGNE